MSRGLGKIERQVIEQIKKNGRKMGVKHEGVMDLVEEDGWVTALEIVWYVDKTLNNVDLEDNYEPSKAIYQSINRAIRSLEKKGYVVSQRKYACEHNYWAVTRLGDIKRGKKWNGGRTYEKIIKLNV